MTIPLFPLKLAVLPKEVLPLHIFEERYKKMITECINSNSLFGIIYREKGEFSKIGCAVKIYKTLNKNTYRPAQKVVHTKLWPTK